MKFRTEIKLLSLTKLRKSFAPRNLLNRHKIDAYVEWYMVMNFMDIFQILGYIFLQQRESLLYELHNTNYNTHG